MSGLPPNWKYQKISDVAEVVSGATPKSKVPEFWHGDILWATPKDLGQLETIEISGTERKITKAGYESCSTRLLPVGSVLLSSRAPIGHLAINTKPICTNQGFKSLIPKENVYNRYLYWVVKMSVPQLRGMGRGCTFEEISKGLVESFEIPVPPLDEQRRIVVRIEELTSRAGEVRKLRQEAMDEVSTQFFHVRRKLFESLKSEWPTRPLGKCGKVLGGGTPSRKRDEYWDGNIPWIAPKEMKGFRIITSSEQITTTAIENSSAKLIPAGSVLFVVRGMILARYIPVAVSGIPCAINQDMKAIVPSDNIIAEYLTHMLWGGNDILQGMVETAGHGTKKLETARWSTFQIPIPDPETQQAIIDELSEFQKKLSELEFLQEKTLEAIGLFQSALLAKAFRGEL